MFVFNHSFFKSLIYIATFGLCGIFSRFFIGLFFNKFFPSTFPTSTFIINILGSFIIGIVYVMGVEKLHISPAVRLGLIVGFLGGFTTFSSFSLDTALLLERGKILVALSYFILSPILGALFTFCGVFLGRKLF